VQEKSLMLGPVLGRLQSEMLDPIIERTFNILMRNGQIPPPPESLADEEITIEYVSPLANAQKGARVTALTNILGLAGQIAGVVPEVIDKIDTDRAIDQAADIFGVSPSLIRDEEQVLAIRQGRAEAEAQAQKQQQIAEAGQTAKDITESEKNLAEADAAGKR